MAVANLFANKIVLSTLNVLLYGGGGGGVVGGVLGLGGEEADIARTEEVYEPETIHMRRSLRVRRTPTQSDIKAYNKKTPQYEAVAGTKLPKGLVETHIYQADTSAALEGNDVNFYCSSTVLNNKVTGNLENRGTLEEKITKSETDGDHSSCVNVMGHKEYYGTSGRGSMKIFQSIESRLYGTMILTTITADKGQLTIDGVSYTLEKKTQVDGDFRGEVKGGSKKDPVILTDENKDKLLMLPGEAIQDKQENWGFDLKTDNICKQGGCYGDADGAKYSNRLGKGEINMRRKKGDSKPIPARKTMKEGSSNFDSGAGDDGMFPKYSSEFHTSLNGYLRLEIDNNEEIR